MKKQMKGLSNRTQQLIRRDIKESVRQQYNTNRKLDKDVGIVVHPTKSRHLRNK